MAAPDPVIPETNAPAPAPNNGGNPYTNIASPVASPFAGAQAQAQAQTQAHPLSILQATLQNALNWMGMPGNTVTQASTWNAYQPAANSYQAQGSGIVANSNPNQAWATQGQDWYKAGLTPGQQGKTALSQMAGSMSNSPLTQANSARAATAAANAHNWYQAPTSQASTLSKGSTADNVLAQRETAAKNAAMALLNGTGSLTTTPTANHNGLDPAGQADLAAWYKEHPGWARDYKVGGWDVSQVLDPQRTQSLDVNSKYYDPSQAYKAGFAYDDKNGPLFARGKNAVAGYYQGSDGRYYPINLAKAWDQLGYGHWRNPYLDDNRWYNYGAYSSPKTYSGGGGGGYSKNYSDTSNTSASSWYNSLMNWKI